MQELNQIFFFIFSLAFLGVYLGTANFRLSNAESSDKFWQGYLLLRSASFFTWGITPWVGPWLVSVANLLFFSSAVLLGLLFRSWNKFISKLENVVAIVISLLIAGNLEYIRQIGGSLNDRIFIASLAALILSSWCFYELLILWKKNKNKLIALIAFLTLMHIVIMGVRMLVIKTTYIDIGLNIIVSEKLSTTLFTWASFGTHLLICIFITAYLFRVLYEKQLITNQNLKNSLTNNSLMNNLLEEKESLLNNLLSINKTSTAGALTASIAHELNQPLGANQLHLDYLKSINGKGEVNKDEFENTIEQIRANNNRASEIIKTLKRIFSDEINYKDCIALDEQFSDIKKLTAIELKKFKIDLKIFLNGNYKIQMGSTEFKQVILNIINNSINAFNQANTLNRVIKIHASQIHNHVEIRVADNGPGINPALLNDIFGMMITNRNEGMGLGLWLSRHIISNRDGEIRHEKTVPGPGATIVIKLPIFNS